MSDFFRRLSLLALLLLSLLLAAGVALVFLTVQDQAWVRADSAEQVDRAETLSGLLPQIKNLHARSHRKQTVTLTEEQMGSLVGLLQRAWPAVQGQVNLHQELSLLVLSIQLPDNPLGAYLNIKAELFPGPGLSLGGLQLGSLSVPDALFTKLLTWLVDWRLGTDIGEELLTRIDRVEMNGQSLTVHLSPMADLLSRLKSIPREALSLEDEQQVNRIAGHLTWLAAQPDHQRLTPYLNGLFTRVVEAISQGAEPVRENEAALLALAIYAGNYRFAHFISGLRDEVGVIPTSNVPLQLAGREDLALHFIYSAAIKLLSEQGISLAIGEFKELMDRARGGSGFSFADLAADMAGIQLALRSTGEPGAAEMAHRLAGVTDESAYFPAVHHLPEGLSKDDFQAAFDKVDSPAYQAQVKAIEQTIQALPIYR